MSPHTAGSSGEVTEDDCGLSGQKALQKKGHLRREVEKPVSRTCGRVQKHLGGHVTVIQGE